MNWIQPLIVVSLFAGLAQMSLEAAGNRLLIVRPGSKQFDVTVSFAKVKQEQAVDITVIVPRNQVLDKKEVSVASCRLELVKDNSTVCYVSVDGGQNPQRHTYKIRISTSLVEGAKLYLKMSNSLDTYVIPIPEWREKGAGNGIGVR